MPLSTEQIGIGVVVYVFQPADWLYENRSARAPVVWDRLIVSTAPCTDTLETY